MVKYIQNFKGWGDVCGNFRYFAEGEDNLDLRAKFRGVNFGSSENCMNLKKCTQKGWCICTPCTPPPPPALGPGSWPGSPNSYLPIRKKTETKHPLLMNRSSSSDF